MNRSNKIVKLSTILILGLMISGCGGNVGASPTPIPLPAAGDSSTVADANESSESNSADASLESTVEPVNSVEAESTAETESAADENDSTDGADSTGDSSENVEVSTENSDAASSNEEGAPEPNAPNAAVAQAGGSAPVQLDIERIRLSAPITPMDWRIAKVGDERTTEWIIPEESAGWHPDSAGVGRNGNVVISGYQNAGSAVFAQLALGNVQVGQEIELTTEDGVIYKYVVSEVGKPIPLDGASSDEEERVIAYYAPSEEAKLTLVTGWPAFTTTHRLFIVATLAGN